MSDIRCQGDIVIDKEEVYDNIDVKGNVESECKIIAKNLKVKGKLNTSNDIIVRNTVNLKGKIKANKVIAKRFDMHGKLEVSYIEAKEIKIISSRNSRIEKIKAQNIFIKNGTNAKENEAFMNSILKVFKINLEYKNNKNSSIFKIDRIEGEHIELTNVTANEIIGDTVILNDCCNIENLVYSKELKKDEDSKVNSQIKR